MNVIQAHLVNLSTGKVIALIQHEVAIMAMNRIQFQPGLWMPEFLKRHGTEFQCAQALESVHWPDGLPPLRGARSLRFP